MSEQSSLVREGAGYDEVYLSRHGLEEDVSLSPKRKLSACSLAKEEEEEYEEDEGEVKGDKDEEGEEEGKEEENKEEGDEGEGDKEVVRQVDSDGPKHFILPLIWTVNDLYPTMSLNIFNKLRDLFQIPDNIPIRLLRKF